jgi:autotransporter-associated beta strand protein
MAVYTFFTDTNNSPIELDASRSHAEHGNQLFGKKRRSLLPAILVFCGAFLIAPFFAHAEDFNWTTVGATSGGLNMVTPVQNQGSSGMCWAFAAVGMLEAKYKITRADPTYTLDLSELQLAAAGIGSYTNGGNTDNCTGYFQSTGLVTESVFPWQSSDLSPNWPNWTTVSSQISSGQVGTVKTTGSRNWIYESTASIKADLKNYGPIGVAITVDNDWYNPAGTNNNRGGHEVVITGFHDNVGSENAPGGGYFIIKNSWGSGWNGNGYAQIAYATLSGSHDLCMITSGAFFTTAMQTVTWDTSTSAGYQPGGGNWSTSAYISGASWSANGTTLSRWRNGEDAAVFDGGGGTYAVNVDYGISAHTVTFNSGASGYTLNGGTLTVTTGGMAVNENVTMNTGMVVGGAQAWTIANGKVLTINANVNTHISPLTVNSIGDTFINGAIRDVHGDSRWNGLLTGSSGSVTKSGAGTLTFSGNNTYIGDTTITAGTIKLGPTPAGLSEGRIDTYFDTTNTNPAASIQLGTRMANTGMGTLETTKTYVYTGYINNPGGSPATWSFAENYNDAVLLKIDGTQVLNNTNAAQQSTGNYSLTPGLHSFELRLGGNSGFNGPNGSGVNGTGLGVAYTTDGGTTYLALTDPGDGSLFRLNNTDGGNMSPASTVVMSSNTTLDLNNYSTTVGALANATGTPTGHRVLLGSATLSVGGNDKSTTFSGVISGSGGLIKIGSGTQTLTGINSYQGGTTFNNGYLAVAGLNYLGSCGFTFNGGGLKFNSIFDPTTRAITINPGGAFFDTNNYTITFNNTLSGTGGVTKVGTGTLVYNAANAYSGNTAITGGTLKTGAANVIPSGSGNGGVSVASGSILDLGGYNQTINGLSGTGTVDNATGASTYSLSVGGNDANSQFNGTIKNSSGKINLNKTGAGTFSIGGLNNTYTGATLITGGTLRLGPTAPGLYEGMLSSYFDTSSVNPKTAVQLTTIAANTSIGATQTWVYSGYINNPGTANATWTFAENYDDAARLLIDGVQVFYSTTWNDQTTGTRILTPGLHSFDLRLGGSGTPNGPSSGGVNSTGLGVAFDKGDGAGFRALTDPGDGSLFRLSSIPNGSLPAATAVVMSSNTNFDLNNSTTTIGSLADADGNTIGHRVLLGAGTLTVGGNGVSTTFSGVISGSGGIIKTGAGILTMKGANIYTGPTSIYSGTFKLDSAGSIAGNIIDVKAGTFDVSSLPNYSLNYGQTIKGNGSILGSMTVFGAVQPGESPGILNTGDVTFGSGSLLDIEMAGVTQGTLYDVLNSSGTINLQNGSELKLSLINGYTPNFGDTFDVLNFSVLSGIFTTIDLPTLANGEYWNLDYLYQNGSLSVVPEPATLVMMLAAFATIGCWTYTRKRYS